jgi:hypothetical protein
MRKLTPLVIAAVYFSIAAVFVAHAKRTSPLRIPDLRSLSG